MTYHFTVIHIDISDCQRQMSCKHIMTINDLYVDSHGMSWLSKGVKPSESRLNPFRTGADLPHRGLSTNWSILVQPTMDPPSTGHADIVVVLWSSIANQRPQCCGAAVLSYLQDLTIQLPLSPSVSIQNEAEFSLAFSNRLSQDFPRGWQRPYSKLPICISPPG